MSKMGEALEQKLDENKYEMLGLLKRVLEGDCEDPLDANLAEDILNLVHKIEKL